MWQRIVRPASAAPKPAEVPAPEPALTEPPPSAPEPAPEPAPDSPTHAAADQARADTIAVSLADLPGGWQPAGADLGDSLACSDPDLNDVSGRHEFELFKTGIATSAGSGVTIFSSASAAADAHATVPDQVNECLIDFVGSNFDEATIEGGHTHRATAAERRGSLERLPRRVRGHRRSDQAPHRHGHRVSEERPVNSGSALRRAPGTDRSGAQRLPGEQGGQPHGCLSCAA